MEEFRIEKYDNYSIGITGNQKKNKYAIIYFVLSNIGVILSPMFLFQILGIIFGVMGLSSKKRELSKKGILISVVTVFLGILVVLMHKHSHSLSFDYHYLSKFWIIVSPVFGLFLIQTIGFAFGIIGTGVRTEKRNISVKNILVSIVSIFSGIFLVSVLIYLNYQMGIIDFQRVGIPPDYFDLSVIGIILSPVFLIFLFQFIKFLFKFNNFNFEKRKLYVKKIFISFTTVFLGIFIISIIVRLNHMIERERFSYDYYVASRIESGIRFYMMDTEDYELKFITDESLDVEILLANLYEKCHEYNRPYIRQKFTLNIFPASKLHKGWDIFVDSENIIVEVNPSQEGHSLVIK